MKGVGGYRLLLGMAVLFSAVVFPGWGYADEGIEVPCVNCPDLDSPVYPESGIWFNPEQSGTGFMFEVQNGHLGGYYYLYDEDGNPVWYLVSGWLEESDDTAAHFQLETELQRHQGGACLNCEYQTPELGESPGDIRLEFFHRNLGRFSVDDGPAQNILPLTHGVPGSRPFRPATDYVFPDLEGEWVLVHGSPGMTGGRNLSSAVVMVMTPRELDPGAPEIKARYRMFVGGNSPILDPPITRSLDCMVDESLGPVCELRYAAFGSHVWTIHLADLGHRRFIGTLTQPEDLAGTEVVEAFRLDYD